MLGRIEIKFMRTPVLLGYNNNTLLKAITAISNTFLNTDEYDFMPFEGFYNSFRKNPHGAALSVEYNSTTALSSKMHCRNHPNCAVFSHLIYSLILVLQDSIVFF